MKIIGISASIKRVLCSNCDKPLRHEWGKDGALSVYPHNSCPNASVLLFFEEATA